MTTSRSRRKQPNEERRRKWLAELLNLGLTMPPDALEEDLWEALMLHRDVSRYVSADWFALTGLSYKTSVKATQSSDFITLTTYEPLPQFDEFVSSFFANWALVVRLAQQERQRTSVGANALTPEQEKDSYKYQHMVRGKPAVLRDEDFDVVASELRRRYAQYFPS